MANAVKGNRFVMIIYNARRTNYKDYDFKNEVWKRVTEDEALIILKNLSGAMWKDRWEQIMTWGNREVVRTEGGQLWQYSI